MLRNPLKNRADAILVVYDSKTGKTELKTVVKTILAPITLI